MPDPIDRPDREAAREATTARDWSGETLQAALAHAAEWTVDYRKRVEERPVLPDIAPGDVRRALAKAPPRAPEPFERVLADFDEHIVSGLTHWNHPAFLAYFSSSTRAPSIAAELLVAAVGVNAMLWRTSPAATEVERTAVDWLRQAVGLPESFSGLIFDTASTSTFTALLAARERAGDGVRDDRHDLHGERRPRPRPRRDRPMARRLAARGCRLRGTRGDDPGAATPLPRVGGGRLHRPQPPQVARDLARLFRAPVSRRRPLPGFARAHADLPRIRGRRDRPHGHRSRARAPFPRAQAVGALPVRRDRRPGGDDAPAHRDGGRRRRTARRGRRLRTRRTRLLQHRLLPRPAGGRPSGRGEAEREIIARVNAEGRSFLSHTELDGRYTVRLSVGSVHTEERHLDDALEALHRAAADLSPGEPG